MTAPAVIRRYQDGVEVPLVRPPTTYQTSGAYPAGLVLGVGGALADQVAALQQYVRTTVSGAMTAAEVASTQAAAVANQARTDAQAAVQQATQAAATATSADQVARDLRTAQQNADSVHSSLQAAADAALAAALATGLTGRRARVAPPAAVALGAFVDLTVTWAPPMPSDSYVLLPLLDYALLGKATVAVRSQAADKVVLRFTGTTLVALNAGGVDVIALAATHPTG